MKNMQTWFDEYGASHKNSTNKAIHWICVPAIFFSLIGLLSLIPHDFLQIDSIGTWQSYLHFGSIFILVGMIFFFRTSVSMAMGMLFVSVAILYFVNLINSNWSSNTWIVYLSIFVLAWIGQFIGHKIEGKKPSFFDDLKFLMIGPAWLLGFIYKKLGIPY